MPLTASIREHGDHVYITSPVQLYEPEQAEIEAFAFAADLRAGAPNPKILWLRGQYVEADEPNRNADMWTAGELAIKSLTPVLMPITVMHDLRSAVGTIADARLLVPEKDQVPRARIDTTLAIWSHRFPEVAEECRINAGNGTLMQSMECLSPFYDCSACGLMMRRGPEWLKEWKQHLADRHGDAVATGERSPARTLRNVTFTGVGLIFGTRGARGAHPGAYLQVEELAAMHDEAHKAGAQAQRKQRRKGFMEIEDAKYEGLVSARSEAEGKVTELTAQLTERDRAIEKLEAEKAKAVEACECEKQRADQAEEKARVSEMRDERLGALGAGFRAKLDKLEATKARVSAQAGEMSDEQWAERLTELEETLGVKRDAKPDENEGDKDKNKGGADTTGLLFSREETQRTGLGAGTEVTAGEHTNGEAPSVAARQSVMGGLIRPRQKAKA